MLHWHINCYLLTCVDLVEGWWSDRGVAGSRPQVGSSRRRAIAARRIHGPRAPPPSRVVCRAFAALAYSLSSEVARWRLRDVFSVTYNGPYRPSTRQQLLRDDNDAFVQLKQCWAFFTPQELPRASENFILWPSSVELLKFYGQIGAWWGSITVPGCM